MTTSAPQRGAGSDDPIGRDFGQDRPTGLSDRSDVRTSSSNAEDNQCNATYHASHTSTHTTQPRDGVAATTNHTHASHASHHATHERRWFA